MKQGDTVAVDIEHDFEASVGYWVTVSALAFRKSLNEELAPHGVTYRQSQVLGWLTKGIISLGNAAVPVNLLLLGNSLSKG